MIKLADFQEYVGQNLPTLPVTFYKCSYVDYAAPAHQRLRMLVTPRFITIDAHTSTQDTVRKYHKPISKSFGKSNFR